KGWGHSSWLEGAKMARQSGAKTLVLFHHDPDSTDRMVDSSLPQNRIHHAIGRIGIVMEKHKGLGPGLPGHFRSLQPRGMPPAFSLGGQLVGGKLRVVNED